MGRPSEKGHLPDDPEDPAVDDAIGAALATVTAEAWAELRAALASIESLPRDGYCLWETVPRPDGVVTLPWPVYVPQVERLLDAIRNAGLVVPYPWPKWEGIDRHRGGRGMSTAPVEDAVRMATAVLRSERFTDGSIDGALRDDTLQAAVRRILAWAD